MSSKIHASTFFSPLSSHPTYPTSTIFPLQNPSGIIVLFPQLKIFSSFLLFAKVNMGPVALCIVALVVISITHWVYRWRNPRCSGELPPGSMGLPLLGETLDFFAPNTSCNIPPFIKKRIDRYYLVSHTYSFLH